MQPSLKSVISEASGAVADIKLKDGDKIVFGKRYLTALSTPGHTNGCMSFVLDDESMVFTGDALLINGCGRTDFQEGSNSTLYNSVVSRLFTLPGNTRVFPGHDYKGRTCSTIEEQRLNNSRLGGGKTEKEFDEIMKNLKLGLPKMIDIAVPKNMMCGV